jgi:hypothetical protein
MPGHVLACATQAPLPRNAPPRLRLRPVPGQRPAARSQGQEEKEEPARARGGLARH